MVPYNLSISHTNGVTIYNFLVAKSKSKPQGSLPNDNNNGNVDNQNQTPCFLNLLIISLAPKIFFIFESHGTSMVTFILKKWFQIVIPKWCWTCGLHLTLIQGTCTHQEHSTRPKKCRVHCEYNNCGLLVINLISLPQLATIEQWSWSTYRWNPQ